MRRAVPDRPGRVPRGHRSRRPGRPHAGPRLRGAGSAARAPVYLFTLDAGQTRRTCTRGCSRRRSASRKTRPPGPRAGRLGPTWSTTACLSPRPAIRNLQGVKMGRPSWIHIEPVLEGRRHRRACRRRGRRGRHRDRQPALTWARLVAGAAPAAGTIEPYDRTTRLRRRCPRRQRFDALDRRPLRRPVQRARPAPRRVSGTR